MYITVLPSAVHDGIGEHFALKVDFSIVSPKKSEFFEISEKKLAKQSTNSTEMVDLVHFKVGLRCVEHNTAFSA